MAYLEYIILHDVTAFEPVLPQNAYRRREHWPVLHHRGAGAGVVPHGLPDGSAIARNATLALERRDCVSVTQHMVPGLVADALMASALLPPPAQRDATRAAVRAMLARILEAYTRRIVPETAWLSASDRLILLEKIHDVVVRVGEPDEWAVEPFAERISHERYAHNVDMVRRYRVERNLRLWPRDRPLELAVGGRSGAAYFAMPMHDVNAYYAADTNTITVLWGVMIPPFYSPSGGSDLVAQYARLGSILGHELGHMLDAHGLHWDAQGGYRPQGILSAEGMAAFYQRAECVVRTFGPAPAHCNPNATAVAYGNATLNEDAADKVGVLAAYIACFELRGCFNDSVAGVLPGTTSDRQRFFMTFAQTWCASYDAAHACDRVAHDVHALPEYRVDRTLAGMSEFRELFGCHGATQEAVCPFYGTG